MRRNKKLPEHYNALETKGTNFLKLHHLYICRIDETAQLFYFVFYKISHKSGVISNDFDHYHHLKFTCDLNISLRSKSTHSCKVQQINENINEKAQSFGDFGSIYNMQKQLKEFLNMASFLAIQNYLLKWQPLKKQKHVIKGVFSGSYGKGMGVILNN